VLGVGCDGAWTLPVDRDPRVGDRLLIPGCVAAIGRRARRGDEDDERRQKPDLAHEVHADLLRGRIWSPRVVVNAKRPWIS
jgi:hypothetical protein